MRAALYFERLKMNHNILKYSIIVTCLLSLWSADTFAQADINPTDIVQKANDQLRGLSSTATMSMEIVRPDWSRTITMKTWASGEDYSLMLITAPARDKGMSILKREKEIWNWQPTIEKVIKLPPSMMMQSMMGSDFTNDDMVRQSSIVADYEHTMIGEEEVEGMTCYLIEFVPKPDAPVVWGKMKMWIEKDNYLQMKTEFYDEDDYLVNSMYGKDVKEMGGRILTTKLELVPADEEGNKTIVTYEDIQFDVDLQEKFFTVQNMKRVR